jgi:hypothetical protein
MAACEYRVNAYYTVCACELRSKVPPPPGAGRGGRGGDGLFCRWGFLNYNYNSHTVQHLNAVHNYHIGTTCAIHKLTFGRWHKKQKIPIHTQFNT